MGKRSARKCKSSFHEANERRTFLLFLMLTAIIVAAGSSRRMGFDKLTAKVAGKPVIEHTVDAFEASASVTDIIVVARLDRISEFEKLLSGKTKLRRVVAGGEHRHDSVNAGLKAINDSANFVAVHDAARPLITPRQIEAVFAQARGEGAATLAEPVTDTLKRVEEKLTVKQSIDRTGVYAMQTPQIFARQLLDEAYAAIVGSGLPVTDEVSAVQHLGRRVVVVPNTEPNFKITYERDLPLAEFVLRQRSGGA